MSELEQVREFAYQKHLNSRSFISYFGVSIEVVAELLSRVRRCTFRALLMALYFLKCYPTEEVGSRFFDCGRETWRASAAQGVERIAALRRSLVCSPRVRERERERESATGPHKYAHLTFESCRLGGAIDLVKDHIAA